MSRKPKPKLPAGWDVYTSGRKPPARRRGKSWWKYGVWGALIGALLVVAFYPWQF